MTKAKKEKHPSILETVHETAKGLHKAEIIDDTGMKDFDELCLSKDPNEEFICVNCCKEVSDRYLFCSQECADTFEKGN